MQQKAGCSIMLDSGAYSAFTRGGSIDLNSYIPFVKANREVTCYVNLDVIPGEPGSNRREWRPKIIDQASRESYENYARMRDAELDPIPVFHQDEAFDWLDRYRDDGARYIALAPYDGGVHCGEWIEGCLIVLSDPTIKMHLLGITSHAVLHHFAPTSCDATTTYQQSKVAQIPVPVLRNGNWDYSLPFDTIAIGHRLRPNHYDLLDEFDQERARHYLEQCGVTIEQARSDVYCRWRVWIRLLNALAASANTTIYFATNVDQNMIRALAQCGAPYHLLSYYDLRRKPPGALERYVRSYENSQRRTSNA
jgi:hypothetical protein